MGPVNQIGKIISDELFSNFFDTDDEIEERTGASIDWIFDLEGKASVKERAKCLMRWLKKIQLFFLLVEE